MADSADSPRTLLDNQYDLIDRRADAGTITETEAELLTEFGQAFDEQRPRPSIEIDGEKRTGTAATVRGYLLRLRVDISENGHTLTEITAEEFNDLMAELDTDRHRTTTQNAQSAAKVFYAYHDHLGVSHEDIEVFETDTDARRVDPRSLYTPEEVEALRFEIDQTRRPLRNRALLEMMIYTGQRIRAIQTLRVGDVEVDEKPGAIYLNDDVEGLKDAKKRGRYRPLTAARSHVRDWLKKHPQGDQDDAWVFIGDPNHHLTSFDQPMHQSSMREILDRAADRAGIYDMETGEGKKPRPHQFRHYWYTHMSQGENVDRVKLKAAGGWSKQSNTPERIYQNFDDEDLMKGIAEELGLVDAADESSPYMPDLCPSCGEPIEKHWERCPVCNEHFDEGITPQEAEEDTVSKRYEADSEEEAMTWAEIQQLIMQNPERARELFESPG